MCTKTNKTKYITKTTILREKFKREKALSSKKVVKNTKLINK